jgi:pimeloyl-ACP methyl ester carboxylesterase
VAAEVELHRWEAGRGQPILLIHETGTSSEAWRSLAKALGERGRAIAYDRRGWGRSGAPEPYTRTTVHEQAEDATRVLADADATPAVLCGAGLGAVVALDLVLGRPQLARAAVAIEPPLLAFLKAATAGLADDGDALREAVREGGPEAGVELFLAGGLPALGAGAGRLPEPLAQAARERPLSLFAELAAVVSWPLPLAEMARNRLPVCVVAFESGPALLREAAREAAGRLAKAELRELPGEGRLDAVAPLADLIVEL